MKKNEVRTLLTGRGLVESPRWHDDRLYFSDWSAGEVIAVDLAGRSDVIARVKSVPLCIAWLPDDRLLIVSSIAGRLLRGNAYVNRSGFNPMAGEQVKPGFLYLPAADARWPMTSRFPMGWR